MATFESSALAPGDGTANALQDFYGLPCDTASTVAGDCAFGP